MQIFPKGIFFSNNDNFVAVIGKSEILIIDTKTGKILFKMNLPNQKNYENINVFGQQQLDDTLYHDCNEHQHES